jgi:hypothetical protein
MTSIGGDGCAAAPAAAPRPIANQKYFRMFPSVFGAF